MRKDLLALAERIQNLELELQYCPIENKDQLVNIWTEINHLHFALKQVLDSRIS